MKLVSTAILIAALSFSAVTFAESGGMGNMKSEDKGTQNCMKMKGMDMKNMNAEKCQGMMKEIPTKKSAEAATSASHETDGVIREVDAAKGKVMLAHEPIRSLGWPAMTMAFDVDDKALFDKLTVGKKVHVGLKRESDRYVVNWVK